MKKWLKVAGIVLAILLLIPALLPNQFDMSRSITIEDPQPDVFSYLVNLENWPEWSPWLAEEPSAQVRFDGIQGVVGSYQEWNGKVVGKGRQTLSLVRDPEYIEFELEFEEPNAPPATSYLKIEAQGDVSLVTWGMKGPLPYPFARVFSPLMQGFMGKKFNEGLKNLKNKLEASKASFDETSQ